ncbi:hypothetical protein GGR58DRAFT_464101 [Xylaria digitata]|nr:hypothetical protein GGR58DRAFT_464101 [Xylaria digitata]
MKNTPNTRPIVPDLEISHSLVTSYERYKPIQIHFRDYSSFFAMTIDNLLTPDECAKLQAAAGNDWQTLSKGNAFRECQNILVFSQQWAAAIYDRIVSHLPEEVKTLRKGDRLAEVIAGPSHLKASMGARKTVWRIKEANERLSFLRYQPGHHFKPHCDALYARLGKDERSFLTCQIYLSDAPKGADGESSGGETRFWTSQVGKRQRAHEIGQATEDENEAPFLDVKPKDRSFNSDNSNQCLELAWPRNNGFSLPF